ncbi:MAG: hypothetical protein KGD63_09570 [Candidatus Lokiarchaeota archaeon]|nr:hypothetical protein [Candidatus Lokiarchaeota archaeon]
MEKKQEEPYPYGYIYRVVNRINKKIYIGQTVKSRWSPEKIPIEERWKEEVGDAYRNGRNGQNLRHIENAIIKFGYENMDLFEQDRAFKDQEELDGKERYWIKEFGSFDREIGYNMTEGGLGGRLRDEVKENLSNISIELWQDLDYKDKQLDARARISEDQEFIEKMTNINQKRAENPEYRKKLSIAGKDKWEDLEYREKISKSSKNNWQTPEHRKNQLISRQFGSIRKIKNLKEFLRDILNMKKKDLNFKYNLEGKCMNREIKKMLEDYGIKNYTDARIFLEGKNLDKIVKEIKEKMNSSKETRCIKKEILDKEEFLKIIHEKSSTELSQYYNMHSKTLNKRICEMFGDKGITNLTILREYTKNKDIKKIAEEINNNREKIQSERYRGTSHIENKKQFLLDILNMQKKDIDYKYGMDAKTITKRINELLGSYGVKNYTAAKEFLKDKDIDEIVKQIENKDGKKEIMKSKDLKELASKHTPKKSFIKNITLIKPSGQERDYLGITMVARPRKDDL